jgi:hypothetical protein
MTGTPQETPPPRTAFAKSYGRPSKALLQTLEPGRATAAGLDGTCSRATHSVWCTSFEAMASRLSPWPTDGGGLAIGGRDSDTPSNFRMQRAAVRAAADPAR